MNDSPLDQEKLQKTLEYIDDYWEKIILMPKKHTVHKHVVDSVRMLIGQTRTSEYNIIEVPYPAVVPNDSKYRYIFYWDTYFIFRGLLETKYEWVIPSMVENFVYLFKRHHIIPNFSHPESLGRSQPPFLSSMILDAYAVLERETKLTHKLKQLLHGKKRWLRSHIEIAQQEYEDVWLSPVSFSPTDYNHLVPEYQLNRYGNRDIGYPQPSEQESGWDMTSRFYNRCNEFLAVDLNTFLYKYEIDFAQAAKILGNKTEEDHWLRVAESRKQRMQLFWNEEKGFFYDYDYVHKEQSEFESLAGFVPMWAGLATPQQAEKMVQKLPEFESEYGLFITREQSLPPILDLSIFPNPFQYTMESIVKPKQWDYPNIWPPLEYLTVIGLLKYGYIDDAKRIMTKSLNAHIHAFEKHQGLLEKLDGLTGDMPPTYWYPTQVGFGWTNAIFHRYAQILHHLASKPLESSRTHFSPQTLLFTH